MFNNFHLTNFSLRCIYNFWGVDMNESIELVRLREFKKESNWSYSKIAARLGLHVQTVMFWFQGSHEPSPLAREKIRAFLEEYSYRAE